MNLPENFEARRQEIKENLTAVRAELKAALEDCGRAEDEVNLIVVTKNHPWTDAYALWTLGEKQFAENRVQELLPKMEALEEAGASPEWHMIGTLQRNKVKYISGKVRMIHSVDSLRLARMIERQAAQREVKEDVLLQVNYSGEESKHGFSPDELLAALPELEALPHVRLRGLMTMAEEGVSEDRIKDTFDGTRKLKEKAREALKEENRAAFDRLSMGMTQDFVLAVRSGATDVRIGSAVLGQRVYE